MRGLASSTRIRESFSERVSSRTLRSLAISKRTLNERSIESLVRKLTCDSSERTRLRIILGINERTLSYFELDNFVIRSIPSLYSLLFSTSAILVW